jgi:hypothetical protein
MADGNAPRTSAQTPHRQASFPEPCRLPGKRGYQLRRPPAWGGTSRLLTNGIGALVRRMRTRATGSMTNIHVNESLSQRQRQQLAAQVRLTHATLKSSRVTAVSG